MAPELFLIYMDGIYMDGTRGNEGSLHCPFRGKAFVQAKKENLAKVLQIIGQNSKRSLDRPVKLKRVFRPRTPIKKARCKIGRGFDGHIEYKFIRF